MSVRLLIIDDEKRSVDELKRQIRGLQDEIAVANDQQAAYKILKSNTFDVALVDLRLKSHPLDLDPDVEVGYATIQHLKAIYPDMEVIAVSAYDVHSEVSTNAIRAGADDFWSKRPDVSGQSLMQKIRQVLSERVPATPPKIVEPVPQEETPAITALKETQTMEQIMARIRALAPKEMTILLEGETGTGKGYFAQEIHRLSPRRDKPFIHLNCPQLTKETITAELFGHVKGTFTGADQSRKGVAQSAAGGTLFLDEIEALDLECQATILNFIAEKQIKAFGGDKPEVVDVRLVVATNRDLSNMVAKGLFWDDLYARLKHPAIVIRPLRERGAKEIERLARLFYSAFRKEHSGEKGFSSLRVSPTVWPSLAQYPYRWPHNVRELKKVVETTILEVRGKKIALDDFLQRMRPEGRPPWKAAVERTGAGATPMPSDRELRVLSLVKTRGGVIRSEIGSALGVGSTAAWSILKALIDRGLVRREGQGRAAKYVAT